MNLRNKQAAMILRNKQAVMTLRNKQAVMTLRNKQGVMTLRNKQGVMTLRNKQGVMTLRALQSQPTPQMRSQAIQRKGISDPFVLFSYYSSTVEIGDFLFHVSENEIKPQIPPAEVDNTDSSEDNQKRKKTKKKAASKKRKSSKVKYRDDQEGFELFPSDENDGDSSGPQKKRRKSHAKQKSSKKSSTSSIKFSRKSEVSDMMKRVKKKLGDSSEQTPEASNSGYGWDSLRDSGSFKRRGSGSGWGSASRWGNASSRLRQQWGSRDNATSTKSGWNRSRETLQPRISRHESSPGRAFDRNAPAPAWAVQRDNSKFRGSGNLDRENQPETGWSGMVNNTAAPRTWNSGSAAPTVVYDNRPQSEWGREMQGSTGRSAQSGNSGQLGGSRLESSRWRSQNEFAPNAKPSPSSSPFNQNYGTPLSVGNVTSGWNQRAGPPSQQGGSSQQSSYFQQYAQPMTAVHGSQPLYNSQDDRLTAQSQQPYSFPLADASHVELQTPIPSQPGAWAASINLSQMTEQVRRPSSSASKETSSKMDERARDNLKKQISKFVIQTLSPYLKQGKITSKVGSANLW